MTTTQNPGRAMARPETQAIEQAQDNEPKGLTLDMVVEMTQYEPAEIALISKTVAVGAPLVELAMFLKACRTLALDPILRQAHWIRRKSREQLGGVWQDVWKGALQVGIDGYRSLADRQGNYAGSEPARFLGYIEITYKERKLLVPEKAQVVCWKIVQGHKAAFTGEARWDEFYPGEAQGFMWIKMPHHMLSKCAEGQALRKGWPALLGGIQLSPEMGDSVAGELEEIAAPQRVVEMEQPARPKPTAGDYDRLIGSQYPDEQVRVDVPAEPAHPEPEPVAPRGRKAQPSTAEPTDADLDQLAEQQSKVLL